MSREPFAESKEMGPGPEEKKRLSRRAFLALGVTGFTLLAATPLVLKRRGRRGDGMAVEPGRVYIKNPAFQKMGRAEGRAVLKTRMADGKELVFEVDEWGEAAWDLALNVEEYQKGKRVNCGSILSTLEKRRGGGDTAQFRRDFGEFVKAAREANLLMDGDQFVWSVFKEA